MAKKGTKTQKGGQEPVVDTVEQVVEPVVESVVEQEQTGGKAKKVTKKRTFKIKLADSEFCSRITGSTPKQAASKALTLLINQKKKSGKSVKGKIAFTIKETTRGSKGKEYNYQGEKIKLKEPTEYTIKSADGQVKTIINKYKNIIEKHIIST